MGVLFLKEAHAIAPRQGQEKVHHTNPSISSGRQCLQTCDDPLFMDQNLRVLHQSFFHERDLEGLSSQRFM